MSAAESPDELLARLQVERQALGDPSRYAPRGTAVAITGGRDHAPSREEIHAFFAIFDRLGGIELHHGDAGGVDRGVAAVARRARPELKIVPHPADWGRLGRAAGPIRNRAMLSHVGALIAWPGGRGTEGCIRIAHQLGIPVYLVVDEVERRRLDIQRDFVTAPGPAA